MSGRTVSGVVPQALHEAAQQAVDYEGTSMSALVSSALALYLGLPGSARRTARYVLASGPAESRDAMLEGCARAIAMAGDRAIAAQLATRGHEMGLQDGTATEDSIATEAAHSVRHARSARQAAANEENAAPRGMRR
jgi:hypothetical protein